MLQIASGSLLQPALRLKSQTHNGLDGTFNAFSSVFHAIRPIRAVNDQHRGFRKVHQLIKTEKKSISPPQLTVRLIQLMPRTNVLSWLSYQSYFFFSRATILPATDCAITAQYLWCRRRYHSASLRGNPGRYDQHQR